MKKFKLTAKDIKAAQAELEKKFKGLTQVSQPSLTVSVPLTITGQPKATLRFDSDAYEQMRALVDACEKEIAWHGLVTKTKSNNRAIYTVEKILVFPQIVTAATVKGKEPDYALWCADLPANQLAKMRLHGHSHVRMAVSPSGVDTNYQDDMVETIEDFYIFMITNKREENWVRIVDVKDNIVYDQNDVDIEVPGLDMFKRWANTEIKKHLTENVPATKAAPAYQGYGSYNSTYQQMVMEQIDRKKAEEAKEAAEAEDITATNSLSSWQEYLENNGYGKAYNRRF